MERLDTTAPLSISEASKLGVSGLVWRAEEGHEPVLLRNNKPVAAVVSMRCLEQLEQLQDDLTDLSLAVARTLTTGPERHTLDDVLDRFGYTRDGLRALE